MSYLRQHLWLLLLSCALTLTVAYLQLRQNHQQTISLLNRIDGVLYDLRLQLTLTPRPSPANIVIIDIDEKSLDEQGRWPWPRAKTADLIRKLVEQGAIVVAFDVLFSEPEYNVLQTIGAQQPQLQPVMAQLAKQYDGDQQLTDALGLTDTVLGVLFQSQAAIQRGSLRPTTVAALPDSRLSLVSDFPGFVANYQPLQQNTVGTGFINSSPDEDGFIRHAALVVQHQGQLYPSLALEAARLYALADEVAVVSAKLGEFTSLVGVKVAESLIPTDGYGRILVPYQGPAFTFPYFSATDVLAGRVKEGQLQNALVFVGTSAVGHADLRATPVGVQYPGVEVHANVLAGLLDPERIPFEPDWAPGAILISLLLIGGALSLLLPSLGPLTSALVSLVVFASVVGFNLYSWTAWQLSLPLASSLLLVVSIAVLNIGFGFYRANAQRTLIKGIFDQYVPPQHIDQLLKDPHALNLDGQRKQMTVLFSDIRGFTNLSETLPANALKQWLNRYFSPITEIIFKQQGTIDKYVGDMVMAFWNAPLDDPKHASHAIQAALEMQQCCTLLSEAFVREQLPAVAIGIGINTGDMNVGDMGSEFRRAYTVLGDSVNLASRLESITKFYGVPILVSEFTKQLASDHQFRFIDLVRVKGKTEPVALYQPLDEAQQQRWQAVQSEYQAAIDAYQRGDFPKALARFTELAAQAPSERLYSLYVERLTVLQDQPTPLNWDGVFTHREK